MRHKNVVEMLDVHGRALSLCCAACMDSANKVNAALRKGAPSFFGTRLRGPLFFFITCCLELPDPPRLGGQRGEMGRGTM